MTKKVKKSIKSVVTQFPTLFPNTKNVDCGNGWADLLESTLKIIKFHVDNPRFELEKFAKIKQWYNSIFWNKIFHPISICFPDKIYNWCRTHLYADIKYVPAKVRNSTKILQVKEKFAGLRIYTSNSDDYINGAIHLAEAMSYSICEICGTNQAVKQNKTGWNKSYCDKCRRRPPVSL